MALTVASLTGHIERDLDADLARFLPSPDGIVELEEEVIEAGTRFADLGVFVWHMVRYRAVRNGTLSRDEVEADFRALAQDGAVAGGVGLLASMR
ncbi:hypothetical protein ACGFJ7_08120 [Actinoplanes sp. NPDC048988]|uniref:hypothetical protein n=1 Tax=Actinoplanes sp. NPDC048988 TaxID=3363901 RepID=UPI003717E2E2